MAFVVEGLLFAFHLEGSELNWKAHLLLVLTIFAAVGAILGEIAAPGNVLLGLGRAQLVMLQGVWFMQIAKLLFEGATQQPAARFITLRRQLCFCTALLASRAFCAVLMYTFSSWAIHPCVCNHFKMPGWVEQGRYQGRLAQLMGFLSIVMVCCRQQAMGPAVSWQRDDGASAVLHMHYGHHGRHLCALRVAAPLAARRPEETFQGTRQGDAGRGRGGTAMLCCPDHGCTRAFILGVALLQSWCMRCSV